MSTFESNGMTVHAHKLIVETAKDMAREVYALSMKKNTNYNDWKRACEKMSNGRELSPAQCEELFVNEYFPFLIEQARATLAALLATPISQVLKDDIFDALIKDTPLREGRLRAMAKAKMQNLTHQHETVQ